MVEQAQVQERHQPSTDTLVEVKNLKMYFPVKSGIIFQKKIADIKAVDDVSFHIKRGETLGLVGESGCGKTTTGRCILQLYHPTEGQVLFEGEDLTKLSGGNLRKFRRRMQMIFQDPYSSLDPRQNCGSIVGEPLIIHKMTNSRSEYQDQVSELLSVVGLSPAEFQKLAQAAVHIANAEGLSGHASAIQVRLDALAKGA